MTQKQVRDVVAKAFEKIVFPYDNESIIKADWSELRDQVADIAAEDLFKAEKRFSTSY